MACLLIDGNPLIWRAYHTVGLDNDGVLRGVVTTIFKLIELFDHSPTIVFWDVGECRWRKDIYPEYKEARRKKKREDPEELEEVFRQTDVARKFVESLGIRQVSVKGVEADDLIGWFSSYLSVEYDYKVTICTTDKDLWQLVDGQKVSVYDVIKKELVDGSSAGPSFGVSSSRLIPEYKALVGDPSDSIKGVKGIGAKTAKALLDGYGDLSGVLDNQTELMKSKRTARIFDDLEQLNLARRLITLSNHREMRFCLNDSELSEFVQAVSCEVAWNDIGAQVAAERVGFMPQKPQDTSVLSKEVLGGIKGFAEREPKEDMPSLALVDYAIKKCDKCALRKCCSTYGPTLPEGYDDVEIMVIGRNPGYEELLEGRPFVGRAGERLDQFLLDVGLTRREVWITNACKCYSENNRAPAYGELVACSNYLGAEIELLQPKFIMTFGNEAMSMVTPHGSGVTRHCGEIHENPHGLMLNMDLQARVAVCVHPSAALRSLKNETEMNYCTEKVREFLESVK